MDPVVQNLVVWDHILGLETLLFLEGDLVCCVGEVGRNVLQNKKT